MAIRVALPRPRGPGRPSLGRVAPGPCTFFVTARTRVCTIRPGTQPNLFAVYNVRRPGGAQCTVRGPGVYTAPSWEGANRTRPDGGLCWRPRIAHGPSLGLRKSYTALGIVVGARGGRLQVDVLSKQKSPVKATGLHETKQSRRAKATSRRLFTSARPKDRGGQTREPPDRACCRACRGHANEWGPYGHDGRASPW